MNYQALPAPWDELFAERAAIKEFDGKMPRAQAEQEALVEIRQRMQGQQEESESDVVKWTEMMRRKLKRK